MASSLVHIFLQYFPFFLVSQKIKYFFELTNTLEWVGYISSLIYVLPNCDCKLGIKHQAGATALFFGWINLILFLRR